MLMIYFDISAKYTFAGAGEHCSSRFCKDNI